MQDILFDGTSDGVVASSECITLAPEECGWSDDTGRSGSFEVRIEAM